MTFPISGVTLDPFVFPLIGFGVGLLSGFFGVGGGVLVGPLLYFVGLPMHFVIGTNLAHLAGKSLVASRQQRAWADVDLKLGLLIVGGTLAGAEAGARLVEALERLDVVDPVIGIVYIVLLLAAGLFALWESRSRTTSETVLAAADALALGNRPAGTKAMGPAPYVNLPISGLERVSLPLLVLLSLGTGVLSGALGIGGGLVRVPAFIYLIGVPVHIALGTDLLIMLIATSYGTLTHAVKGNVDVVIALLLHAGAVAGVHLGGLLVHWARAPRRASAALALLPLLGALILAAQLLRV